jgi:hypothetical protein
MLCFPHRYCDVVGYVLSRFGSDSGYLSDYRSSIIPSQLSHFDIQEGLS